MPLVAQVHLGVFLFASAFHIPFPILFSIALPWLVRKHFNGKPRLFAESWERNQTVYSTYNILRSWEVRKSSNEPPGLEVASPAMFSLGRGVNKG